MAERTEPDILLMYLQPSRYGRAFTRLKVMALFRLLNRSTYRLLGDTYSVAVACRYSTLSPGNGGIEGLPLEVTHPLDKPYSHAGWHRSCHQRQVRCVSLCHADDQ